MSAQSGFSRVLLSLIAAAMVLGSASQLEAAAHRQKNQGKTRAGAKARPPSPAAARASARAKSKTEAEEAKIASRKVAVFAFEGDDAEPLRKHVIQALSDKGLQIETTLKPLDTAEQYRDMGATLELAGYVHGRIKDTNGEHAIATVVIRSAVTGRKLATATFNGFRRGLPFDVEEKLWERVGTAVVRACVEASKPGRRHNKPMRIEAGAPL
jgi:hypothetical protein